MPKVLVVDDDSLVRGLMVRLVEKLKIEVDDCASGDLAMIILTQSQFDLVISDWDMPGLCRWDLIKKIRETNPQQEILIVSGGLRVNDRNNLRQLGMDFLSKPFMPEKFQEIVVKLLSPAV